MEGPWRRERRMSGESRSWKAGCRKQRNNAAVRNWYRAFGRTDCGLPQFQIDARMIRADAADFVSVVSSGLSFALAGMSHFDLDVSVRRETHHLPEGHSSRQHLEGEAETGNRFSEATGHRKLRGSAVAEFAPERNPAGTGALSSGRQLLRIAANRVSGLVLLHSQFRMCQDPRDGVSEDAEDGLLGTKSGEAERVRHTRRRRRRYGIGKPCQVFATSQPCARASAQGVLVSPDFGNDPHASAMSHFYEARELERAKPSPIHRYICTRPPLSNSNLSANFQAYAPLAFAGIGLAEGSAARRSRRDGRYPGKP
jgi:hypothetical protein